MSPFFWWKIAVPLALARRRAAGPWILGYHRVTDDPVPGATPPAVFEEHLEVIRRIAVPLPLSDFLRRLAAGRLKGDEIALTFDDGYRDQGSASMMALKEEIPPTVFVPTAFPDSGRSFFWEGLSSGEAEFVKARLRAGEAPPEGKISSDIMGWRELKRLVAEGVSVESHSHSHRILSALSEKELCEEFTISRRLILDRTGYDSRIVAYPNGDWGDFGPAVDEAARLSGIEFGITAVFGAARPVDPPWRLRRVMVAGEPAETLRSLLLGGRGASKLKGMADRMRGRK